MAGSVGAAFIAVFVASAACKLTIVVVLYEGI